MPQNGMMSSYREDYFLRLRARLFVLEAMAPLALALLWWTDSLVTGTVLFAWPRLVVWLVGSAAVIAQIAVLRRITSLRVHGWMVIAMVATLELAFVLIITPTERGLLWATAPIMLVPIVIAPFWIWSGKNVICCLACYCVGSLALFRIAADGPLVAAYAGMAALCTTICVAMFFAADGPRRNAHMQQKQLDHEATHDALTGLPSCRRFIETGEAAVRMAQEKALPLSVCFMDLDSFKAVNDQHGHAAGDVALARVATLMIKHVRAPSTTARMGGEEFVMLLPETDAAAAMHFANTLRRAIEATDMGGFHVTISAGVAQRHDEELLARTMQRADEALLAAKRHGRNRVELSQG